MSTCICFCPPCAFQGLFLVACLFGERTCHRSIAGARGKRSSADGAAHKTFIKLLYFHQSSRGRGRRWWCCLPPSPALTFPFPRYLACVGVTRSSPLVWVAEGSVLPAQWGTLELSPKHRLVKERLRLILSQPASLALRSCLWLCCFIVLVLAVIPSNGKTCCSLKADGNSFLKEKICLFRLLLLFSFSFIFCLWVISSNF